jgi:hypothetical protein
MRRLLASLATLLPLVACGPQAAVSTPTQLTREDFGCKAWPQARLDAMKARIPNGFLVSWQGEALDRVHQAMAGIPDTYLTWLYGVHARNGFSIKGQSPGFNGGVTQLTDTEPTDMRVTPNGRVVDLSLQHEIGHAINPYMWTVASTRAAFDRELGQLADADYANSNLNAYPKSYPRGSDVYHMEFWAEAFNSFYCSEATNDLLKTQFPSTYAFLARSLEKPVWEANDPSTASVDADLFVLVEPDAGDATRAKLRIAGKKALASTRLCLDDLAACKASLKNDVAFAAAGGASADRAYFAASAPLTVASGAAMTLLGLDADGRLVSAKAVKLDPAD